MNFPIYKILFAAFLIMLSLTAVGCGAINAVQSITDGDVNLKTTNELWSDVPRMDGLTTSEMEMPLFAKMIMRTALNTMGEGKDTGDWIVFSSRKTPDDVKNFYTNDRMAAHGWEPSQNSTCLDGSGQGIPGVGIFCVFEKIDPDKRIELLLVASQDDKTKETTVFFVRVQELTAPAANSGPTPGGNAPAPPKPSNGGITMHQGPAPYGIEKRPMPSGFDLDQLLPKQVGPYTRATLEASSQQGVPATSVKPDGDSLYAHYRSGATEIFVEFAISSRAEDAQIALDVAAAEVVDTFPTDPRFGSLGTEPSYLKANNEYGAFFAWTRGGYYFSVSAKSGEHDLDAFLQAFPY